MQEEAPPDAADTAEPDTFERLFEQARMAYDLEVGQLRQEVKMLRGVLAGNGQLEVHAKWQREGAVSPASNGRADSPGSQDQAEEEEEEEDSPPPERRSKPVPETGRSPSLHTTDSKLTPVTRRKRRGLTGSNHHKLLHSSMHRHEVLWRIVHHWAFELSIASLIIANGLAIAVEAQYHGLNLAKRVGHASAGGAPADSSSEIPAVFDIINWCFGALFLVEVLLRIAAGRMEFLKVGWNWLDIFIVVLWTVGEANKSSFDAQILRLARLARLLRLVQLVKHMKSRNFDSLYLMATALSGALSVLLWSFCLMLLVHFVLGLAINQGLRELYFASDPVKAAEQVEVFEYFGSFSRCFLTMFEITLANWPVPCRILVEQVSEWFVIYAIVHKMTLGFAAIGIINAIFVQETFKVASADNHVMVKQTMHKQRLHREKMARLFEEADEDGDGGVSLEEWEQVCKDEWVKAWLSSQDVNVSDTKKLFEMLDNGDGQLTADELIQGTARLKGPAQAMYVAQTVAGIDRVVREVKDELLAERQPKRVGLEIGRGRRTSC